MEPNTSQDSVATYARWCGGVLHFTANLLQNLSVKEF